MTENQKPTEHKSDVLPPDLTISGEAQPVLPNAGYTGAIRRPARHGLLLLCPHRLVESVLQIQPEEMAHEGVEGIILDLDNTLVAWRSEEMTAEVEAWLLGMRRVGFRLCILSNSPMSNRSARIAARLNCSYVRNGHKPSLRGFRKAMAAMGTVPANTAIVGDQMFTDVLGGNRAGIYTVMVKPLFHKEFISTRIMNRPPERLLLRYFKRRGKL